jgi:RNA 3'-terminal phosphate cyclase
MKITKRQLRRIIKEEKVRILREQSYPSPDGDLTAQSLDNDMQELMELVARAEDKATEIESKMQDVEYGQHAGGREADDLHIALENVWVAFGMEQGDY